MTTINISLPTSLFQEVKNLMAKSGYSSVSEVVRDALRHLVHPHITENGFTPEFEQMVLESAKEPIKKAKEWKSAKEIDAYFDKLKRKVVSNGQNKKNRKV